MNTNQLNDSWYIIEDSFDAVDKLSTEGQFSLGNGNICQQANFEEYYSGETMLGSYIEGVSIHETDKINLWRNGLQQAKDKIANIPNWIGIIVRLNEDKLDLASWEIVNYKRMLNMKEGFLERTFDAISSKGRHIQVTVRRFLSIDETEVAAITYSIKSINFEGRISFMPILDGDLKDQLENQNETIWNVLQTKTKQNVAHLWTQIRRVDFHVCTAMTYAFYKNNEQLNLIATKIEKEKVAGFSVGIDVKQGDTLCLNKFVAILNSRNHPRKNLTERACEISLNAKEKGWNKLFEKHSAVMSQKWTDLNLNNDILTNEARFKMFRSIQHLD